MSHHININKHTLTFTHGQNTKIIKRTQKKIKSFVTVTFITYTGYIHANVLVSFRRLSLYTVFIPYKEYLLSTFTKIEPSVPVSFYVDVLPPTIALFDTRMYQRYCFL